MEATLPSADLPSRPRQHFARQIVISLGTYLLMHLAFGCAGQSDGGLTPVPTNVNLTLNLTDKSNENLAVKGGYVVSNNVIIAQTKEGKFVAVSVDCTFDKTKLIFKPAESQFYCPADLSRFDTSGKVVIGPATLPLTKYIVEQNVATGAITVHN